MTNILILSASGQVARLVVDILADRADVAMTLFLRDLTRLGRDVPANARVIEGDALDRNKLKDAVASQDVVFANLAGNVDAQVNSIIASMQQVDLRRLIFCASLGIYNEVPGAFGEWNQREVGPYLPPFRKAADAIEASGLDYAILRPAWLTDDDEIDFEVTERDEPFRGSIVSRKSVAAFVAQLAETDVLGRRNVGINKPNTDRDKLDLY